MNPPQISVIICTHNPRADYLGRTLDGLRSQELSAGEWELVLVDNASPEPVAPRFDLGWHPRARVVVEPEMGLTAARLRGISEASAPLLVFVDDDNVLSADYLKRALSLAALADRWASERTSSATTANPAPDSPARAASTAALSARMLV